MAGSSSAPAAPQSTGAQTGAKMFGTVAGMGFAWFLHRSGKVEDVAADGIASYKAPFRIPTTRLLMAGAFAGYLFGTFLGNAVHGEKPKKAVAKKH